MKRRNVVFLGGPLLEVATRMDVVDNTSKQVLVGTVVTDLQGCGGYHPVVFLERQAIEVLVFRQYAMQQGQVKLTVTVDGWLRSAPHLPAIVADRVKIDVAESVRRQAAQRVQEILSGQVIPATPCDPVSGNGACLRPEMRRHGNPVRGATNYVSLAGHLRSIERTRVPVEGIALPGARGYIETDAPEYGARHPVSFPFDLAPQVLDACASGEPVEVALHGWLWSDPVRGWHRVHADDVQFL